MAQSEEKLNELEEMIQDLETQNNEWSEKYGTLEKKVAELSEKFDTHSHNNLDGSKFIQNYIPKLGEDGDIVSVGNQGGFGSASVNGTKQFVIYGGSPEVGSVTIGNQIERGAMQMVLFPQLTLQKEDPNSKYDNIMFQGRSLLQLSKIDIPIESGATTISIEDVVLKIDEFVGRDAIISMTDDLTPPLSIFSSRVISNTTNTITFEDAFPVSTTLKFIEVHTPVTLGVPSGRLREIFVSGKKISTSNVYLILGAGITGKAVGIYISYGAPNSSSPNGSICMDIVGGRMYVHQSGSWVIK